ELHPGPNDVTFYGTQWDVHGYKPGTSLLLADRVPFQQAGQIYDLINEGSKNSYFATTQWSMPFTNIPLTDGPGADIMSDGYGVGDWGNSAHGLFQYVSFFQGLLNGQKQTFFVTAKTKFTHIAGDGVDYSKAQLVDIDIYAFSGGSTSNSSPKIPEAPGFEPIGGLETKYKYCDAEHAMLIALPIVPTPLKQLQDRQALARQGAKQQTCP
ncbi:MAG TPA: hypothetical protein VGG44_02540, partial [Tepidisphaeraceae bacterium]